VIVDMHAHLPRPLDRLDQVDEVAVLTARMVETGCRAGIDRQVILGLESGAEANEALHRLVDRFPNRLVAFMRGSFVDPDSPALLEQCVREYGFKGLKLHEEPTFPLTGLLGGHALFRKAGELGVPVVIHSWHEEEGLADVLPTLHTGYFPMALLRELGRIHPDTTFIFAHAGGIWVKAFQAAQPFPNICFDLSGFDPERGIVEKAVEVLGAERIFWGSDVPGRNYVAQLAKVRYADVGDREKQLILGGNAARLLKLESPQ
jgi:predicted TIM-barrel fold metal-dependent hydrolase